MKKNRGRERNEELWSRFYEDYEYSKKGTVSGAGERDPSDIINVCSESLSLFQVPIRKHAYSNILKISPSKNENFQIKSSDIFHIFAQNIDCGSLLEPPHRGGSNEYHNLCF